MTERPLLLAVFIIIISILSGTVSARAINYSADLEGVSPVGAFVAKVYVMDDMQRMEMNAGGKQAITILRGDKKIVWMLMPENKLYVEMPIDLKRDLPPLPPFNGTEVKVEKEPLGTDTVDGRAAKKYHVNIVRGGKKESSGFVWEAGDLDGLPVKFQTEDRSTTMTWKNIKEGAAGRSLFEIPAGYKKIELSAPAPPTGTGPAGGR